MDTQILKIVGQVAGIGGLALGVLLLLFREIIRIKIFPQLTKAHAYSTIRLILLLVWSVALAGIAAWLWVETSRLQPPQDSRSEESRSRTQPSQDTTSEESELLARVDELERDVPSFKEEWKREAWAKVEATNDPREICFFIVRYPSDPLSLLAAYRITKLATPTVAKALEVNGSAKTISSMTSDEIYQTVRNICEQAPFSFEARPPGHSISGPLDSYTETPVHLKVYLSHWEITGNCGEGGLRPGGDFYYDIRANGITLVHRGRDEAKVDVPAGGSIEIGLRTEIEAPASGVAINATLHDRESGIGSDPELNFIHQVPQGAKGEFRVNSSSRADGCSATLVLSVG